jgi:SAM-dependent methyltransferase
MLRSDVAAHGGAPVLAPELDAQQHRANDQLWRSGGQRLVAAYANRVLRPAEVLLLVRHREALSGRVLELGCGAGRLTGYLVDIARAIVGIDISSAMVAYCRERYPRGTFREGDLRDLATIERGSFDVVVAAYNILDALTDAERAQVLDGIHAVLPPDGLLIFSSHNRAFAPRIPDAMNLRGKGLRHLLVTAIHLPGWRRNRRRPAPVRARGRGPRDPQRLDPRFLGAPLLHHPRRPGAAAGCAWVPAARVPRPRRPVARPSGAGAGLPGAPLRGAPDRPGSGRFGPLGTSRSRRPRRARAAGRARDRRLDRSALLVDADQVAVPGGRAPADAGTGSDECRQWPFMSPTPSITAP